MLTVNIYEWANLTGEATDGYELIVNAGDGAPLSVNLTNGDLVATLRGDLKIHTETVGTRAYGS
jgi:hypothetical protein